VVIRRLRYAASRLRGANRANRGVLSARSSPPGRWSVPFGLLSARTGNILHLRPKNRAYGYRHAARHPKNPNFLPLLIAQIAFPVIRQNRGFNRPEQAL
jgi:hypothetical protein